MPKIDLGREESNHACCAPVEAAKKDSEKTIYYPTFYIGNRWGGQEENPIDLGQLKGGQELPATVRVKGVTREEKADGSVRYSYDFEVVSVDAPGSEKKAISKTTREDDEEAVEKGLDEATKEKGEDYE